MHQHTGNVTRIPTTYQPKRGTNDAPQRGLLLFAAGMVAAFLCSWVFSALDDLPACPPPTYEVRASNPPVN